MYVCNPLPVHTQNERAPGKMSVEPHLIKTWNFVKYLKIIITLGAIATVIEIYFTISTYFINSKYFCKIRIFPKKHMCLCV